MERPHAKFAVFAIAFAIGGFLSLIDVSWNAEALDVSSTALVESGPDPIIEGSYADADDKEGMRRAEELYEDWKMEYYRSCRKTVDETKSKLEAEGNAEFVYLVYRYPCDAYLWKNHKQED